MYVVTRNNDYQSSELVNRSDLVKAQASDDNTLKAEKKGN